MNSQILGDHDLRGAAAGDFYGGISKAAGTRVGLAGEEARISTNQEQGAHGLVREAARVSTSMNNQMLGDHDLRGTTAGVSNGGFSKAAGTRVDGADLGLAKNLVASHPNYGYTIIDSLVVDAGRDAPRTMVGADDVHRVSSHIRPLHYGHGATRDAA
ncbi:hypothetical protein TorRG33x02_284580, partial [Trema orientale]